MSYPDRTKLQNILESPTNPPSRRVSTMSIGGDLQNEAGDTAEAAQGQAIQIKDNAANAAKDAANDAKNAAMDQVNAVKNQAQDAVNNAKAEAQAKAQEMADQAMGEANQAKDAVMGAVMKEMPFSIGGVSDITSLSAKVRKSLNIGLT